MQNIYKNILKLAYDNNLILNLMDEQSAKEAWFILHGVKYIYKIWKIPIGFELEAVYRKIKGQDLKLLTDIELTMLHNSLSEIGMFIKEDKND